MTDDCLEIGTVQSFIDGELGSDSVSRVTGHIAVCDPCASMLAEAEDQSAIVFPALERELGTLVPTQRLWNKINDSIAEERKARPFWKKLFGPAGAWSLTPSMAAAGSLLIVAGVVSLAVINRGVSTPEASVTRSVADGTRPESKINNGSQTEIANSADPSEESMPSARPIRAEYRPVARNTAVAAAAIEPRPSANVTPAAYMPGEQSYIRTIDSLARTIAGQKDDTIRGSERMSFERDMAVVDDAIAKMRAEVRKNPKNESAKQVLYSSYQNKIDLLNSVSQKEELVASLK